MDETQENEEKTQRHDDESAELLETEPSIRPPDNERNTIASKENEEKTQRHDDESAELLETEPSIRSPDNERNAIASKETYPKHIFFIIGNEFCERFSFYGMRTILVLYARNYLLFDDDSSTAFYHGFTLLAYMTPLFGGILADSYLGKYKTIAYLSVVYVLGHVFKTIAAIPYIPSQTAHLVLSLIGLLLIAIGTGGIKPCVSALGGDQFSATQEKYRSQFFSMFYFSINLGSLISKWLTPIFRADLDCYPGQDDPLFRECYSVAFGVPGLLMLIALVLFLAGTRYYTLYKPEGSIFWKFCKCVWSACKNKWKSRNKSNSDKKHWIHYADASEQMKGESIAVLRVLFLFLPLPFFWALFDQQGSRWTLQALQLDGYWGNYLVKPEQIDVINPILIVTLIPLFEVTLYPLLRRYNLNFSPLRRMTTGLVLAGFSFVCAAILQFHIDNNLTVLPTPDQYSARIINVSPCEINLASSSKSFDGIRLKPNGVIDKKSEPFPLSNDLDITYKACNGSTIEFRILKKPGHVTDVILGGLQDVQLFMPTKKLENGSAIVSFINVDISNNVLVATNKFSVEVPERNRSSSRAISRGMSNLNVTLIESGQKKMVGEGSIFTEPGGSYTVILLADSANLDHVKVVNFNNESQQLLDINPSTINIAWMIPQYFIITVGEVFLSVTGLEFSYTQAPQSMKSVVASFWLLTISMGSVIVLLIAETKPISRQAHEFLLFSGLIGVAAIIFAFMAKSYNITNEADLQESENKKVENDEDQQLAAETNF